MKVAAVLLTVLLGPIQRPATVTLEGSIARQGTGEGISDVSVMLIGLNPKLPQTPEANQTAQSIATALQNELATSPAFIEGLLFAAGNRTGISSDLLQPTSSILVKTDSGGSFSFKDLQPGRYVLTARKDGFLAPRALGNSGTMINQIVAIEADSKPARLDLQLVKGGVITGRVLDPFGQPATNTEIIAYETYYPGGKAAWTPRITTTTDDRGEYRLSSLPPGKYFVGIAVSAGRDTWQTTFFPGVTMPEAALALTVNGDEIAGIHILIRNINTPTYKVRGTATHPIPAAPTNSTTVPADRSISEFYLVPHEPTVLDYGFPKSIRNAIPAGARPNGEFEIQRVKPGTYDLYPAFLDFSVPGYLTSRTAVMVKDEDVTGLSLTTSPGATLEAAIITDGVFSQPFKMDSLHLRFAGLDSTPSVFIGPRSDIAFDTNGRITTQGLIEARYQFWLTGLPETAYISDIRQGGKSVYDEGVVLDQELKPVQIVINASGAAVSGIVQSANRKPVSNATVILIPPASRRGNSRLYRTAITGGDGQFSMTGIMPGTYSILALQDHPSGEPWLNPDFLATFQDKIRPVTLNSGSSTTVQLEPMN